MVFAHFTPELLRALNVEQQKEQQEQREQELGLAGIPPAGQDYADPVLNELELASKFEVLKKLEEDLRAEQELVDKSALLMKMLEVSIFKKKNKKLLKLLRT